MKTIAIYREILASQPKEGVEEEKGIELIYTLERLNALEESIELAPTCGYSTDGNQNYYRVLEYLK